MGQYMGASSKRDLTEQFKFLSLENITDLCIKSQIALAGKNTIA